MAQTSYRYFVSFNYQGKDHLHGGFGNLTIDLTSKINVSNCWNAVNNVMMKEIQKRIDDPVGAADIVILNYTYVGVVKADE